MEGEELPDRWDWWEENPELMGKIKDQGQYWSCWAVVVATAIEKGVRIFTRDEVGLDLSAQQLIDCCTKHKEVADITFGIGRALTWVKENGLALDGPYGGYTGVKGECKMNDCHMLKLLKDTIVLQYDVHNFEEWEDSVKRAIKRGPVVTAVRYDNDIRYVTQEVYEGPLVIPGLEITRHAIILTGYETDHWIADNSWGTNWGDKGRFKIARPSSFYDGYHRVSPLLNRVIYPVLDEDYIKGLLREKATNGRIYERSFNVLVFNQEKRLFIQKSGVNWNLCNGPPGYRGNEVLGVEGLKYAAVRRMSELLATETLKIEDFKSCGKAYVRRKSRHYVVYHFVVIKNITIPQQDSAKCRFVSSEDITRMQAAGDSFNPLLKWIMDRTLSRWWGLVERGEVKLINASELGTLTL